MFTTLLLAGLTTLTTLTHAAPTTTSTNALTARQECYPWFIAALPESCAVYDPVAISSGPEQHPPVSAICQPLTPERRTFPAASVNPNACPDQPFTVTLYATADCTDAGTVFTGAQCLTGPPEGWVAYSAVPVNPV